MPERNSHANTMPENNMLKNASNNVQSESGMTTNTASLSTSPCSQTKILLDLVEPALIKAGEQAKRLAEDTNTPYVGR